MKRIAILIPVFLAMIAFGVWVFSHTSPAALVLTVPAEERATYKENFQDVRKWVELNDDYAAYALADPQKSIPLRNISLDVIVKLETAATPSDWTDKEFQSHYTKATEELANKLRTALIETLKSKCEVADNAGQTLFILVYIDGYDLGGGKARAAFRPAMFLFDTRAKSILWFLNKPATSKRIASDELIEALEASTQQALGLDIQAHNREPLH